MIVKAFVLVTVALNQAKSNLYSGFAIFLDNTQELLKSV